MFLPTAFVLYTLLIVQCHCLWPAPREIIQGSSVCWISQDLQLSYGENPKSWSTLHHFLRLLQTEAEPENVALINAAFTRTRDALWYHTFIPWKFHSRDESFEPTAFLSSAQIRLINVEQHRSLLKSQAQEAYELTVSKDCKVLIEANHPLGVINALKTFTQLFYKHTLYAHDKRYMNNAPLRISDEPAFEHRGLNLDISRNIISPEDVMRNIDAMAFCKFNRLHIHASDAQSWPLEIPSLPELAEKGAYHRSQIWSTTDLRDVQHFGKERGIEVYIEIDMPGHTASIQHSHPKLITSYNRKPWPTYSAQPPSGQLDLNSSATPAFVDTLLSDLLPRTQNFSHLFHVGGDEITASAYNMTRTELKPYLQAFIDHAVSLIKRHGVTPVVWEELLLDYNLSLPTDTLIQTWRGATPTSPRSSLAQVIERGHRALFGPNDYWYLDCGHGTWLDPSLDNNTWVREPYTDYCHPYKNFRHILSYEPLADIPKSQRHLVVGGEVHLWGELTDGENLDAKLWPRAAAAAEVLWAGRGQVGEESTRRLAEIREWIVGMGVGAGPVQVLWCLMNEGNCVV